MIEEICKRILRKKKLGIEEWIFKTTADIVFKGIVKEMKNKKLIKELQK